jgi:hypothetical protein
MTSIPAALNPGGEIEFLLPSGRAIGIPRARPLFPPWRGTPAAGGTSARVLLDFHGRPASAALAVLWALQAGGWQGVMIDHEQDAYRADWPENAPAAELPPEAKALVDRINQTARKRKGTWDLFCWKEDRFLFAAVKRFKQERFNSAQLSWLEAGLMSGLTSESFVVIEWAPEAGLP